MKENIRWTAFEQDIDRRTREYFDSYLPWTIDDYNLQQMQHLYKQYWAEIPEEQT